VEIPLGSSNARRLWIFAPVAISALLIAQAARIWLADDRVDSGELAQIERGTELVPGNADAWDRLGRFRQWDFANPDPAAAILDYQRAVREDPFSPYYWMDLAGAYEQAGAIPQASEAYGRAKAVYPISAEVAWQYGNFLLRQQQSAEGLRQIQSAVSTDPSLLSLAISRVWLSTHDVHVLLDQVLPPNVNAYFKALDFFQSTHNAESALIVWSRLLSLNRPFPFARAFPFLRELIDEDRSEEARRVWLEDITATGIPLRPQPVGSLIWDGGFTQAFTNGGLGWQWDSPLGVAIDFDAPRIPSGTRSVRLDFGGGNNTDLDAPFQYVAVEPSRAYHFQGYLKTDRITTESGMRFSILDPHHPGAVNATTDNLTASNPWTAADADFSTGPETHFLLVRLYRSPSRLFENKLAGTVWMADVSLTPSEPQSKAAKP
jgi:tetratricopeptide (TPR) repeat protein